MTVGLCIHLQCDNGACPIAVVVPISTLTLPEDWNAGDKLVPALPDNYQGWAARDGKHYCPWCKDRGVK